jgi:hypothetical protein
MYSMDAILLAVVGSTEDSRDSARSHSATACCTNGRDRSIDAALRDHVVNEEGLLAAMTTRQREQLEELLRTLLHNHERQE